MYVKASAITLGHREDTAAAVADGRYDPDFHSAHGYLSVSVADDDRPAMELAVDAAKVALSRSGVRPEDVRLVIHASCERQGPDHIPPASYIQGRAVGGVASAVEVKQACNGGIAALELGAAYLSAAPARSAVLLTASDRCEPGANRYSASLGDLAGDGATGLILSRGGGVARVRATVITGDGRFLEPTTPTRSDKSASRLEFLEERRRRNLLMSRTMSALQRESVKAALADAGADSTEISRWVFPNVGLFLVDKGLRGDFGIEDKQTTWDWGRTVGHLGAGSQVAGLTHLIESGAVRTGDLVALCGNGAGFSYGCAVLEITAEPAW